MITNLRDLALCNSFAKSMLPAALLVSLITGCSGGSASDGAPQVVFDACLTTVVTVDASASAEERAAVMEGLALWNAHGVTRFTTEEIAGAPRIHVIFQEASPAFHGFYDADTGQVYVNHALYDGDDRRITVAHELGHALGLPHIDNRASVMRKANLEIEPNAADAAEVQALWGPCPL